jgi:hypothetical protein
MAARSLVCGWFWPLYAVMNMLQPEMHGKGVDAAISSLSSLRFAVSTKLSQSSE